MRPNPVVLIVFSLAAAPALAQGVAPADRYGASTPRPVPVVAQGAVLNWTGKAPAAAVSASPAKAAQPQLIPGGLLAHSSVAARSVVIAAPTAPAAPVLARPVVAAPKAPVASAPMAPPRTPMPASAAPSPAELARMAAAAPDGLLGVPPPVRDTPMTSGSL